MATREGGPWDRALRARRNRMGEAELDERERPLLVGKGGETAHGGVDIRRVFAGGHVELARRRAQSNAEEVAEMHAEYERQLKHEAEEAARGVARVCEALRLGPPPVMKAARAARKVEGEGYASLVEAASMGDGY